MIDIQEDRRQAEEWENGLTDGSLSIDQIAYLARMGVSTCDSYCGSREYVGENRCYCIRARFPSPAHFELYLLARERYQKLISIGLLAAAVSQKTQGKIIENT